jgi:hypothetical protein
MDVPRTDSTPAPTVTPSPVGSRVSVELRDGTSAGGASGHPRVARDTRRISRAA